MDRADVKEKFLKDPYLKTRVVEPTTYAQYPKLTTVWIRKPRVRRNLLVRLFKKDLVLRYSHMYVAVIREIKLRSRVRIRRIAEEKTKGEILRDAIRYKNGYIRQLFEQERDPVIVAKLREGLVRDFYFPKRRDSYKDFSPLFSNHELTRIKTNFEELFGLTPSHVRSLLRVCLLINEV